MSVAQAVQNRIETMQPGQIFGYRELPGYAASPAAVIKAVSRLVSEKKLERFSKGQFYVPKKGLLGNRKPSDRELIRTMLYKDGRLRGYITGLCLYNQLGLTPQVPRTVTLAVNGGRQEKDFGTIRVKTIVTRTPVAEENVKLLQYLDALKDIKIIPDADISLSLRMMRRYISELSRAEQTRLLALAQDHYGPQVRALVGMLFANLGWSVPDRLKQSLNPTTTYKLPLNQDEWPEAREWNIRP